MVMIQWLLRISPEYLATVLVAKSNLDMVIEMMLIYKESQVFFLPCDAVVIPRSITVQEFDELHFKDKPFSKSISF